MIFFSYQFGARNYDAYFALPGVNKSVFGINRNLIKQVGKLFETDDQRKINFQGRGNTENQDFELRNNGTQQFIS